MRKKLFMHKKANAGVKGGFKIEIQTTSDGQSFTLPLVAPNTIRNTEGGVAADYGYDCVVDWGDGNTSTVQAYNDANGVHSYETAGTYEIEIKGQCDGWSFNNAGSKLLITKIKSWGGEDFEGFCYLRYGFYGCTNLASLPENQSIKQRLPITSAHQLFDSGQAGGAGLEGAIPVNLFCNLTSLKTAATAFNNSNITSIPADLFRYNPLITSFSNCFQFCSNLASIPSGLFDNNTLVTNFSYCFYGCSQLASIPSGLFDNNTLITSFSNCFQNCSNIASIPSGLFDNNTLVTNFSNCFYSCSQLASIPSGLFDNNTLITSFSNCFQNCSNITSIPSGLFDNNTLVTSFGNCFSYCSQLASIPSGLFDNNTLVTNFSYCFYGCSQLASIPSGLFDNNTLVTSFGNCFSYCSQLASIPAGLFDNNTKVTDFGNCFSYCNKLQLRSDIFDFANFLNKSMLFSWCFYRTSFTGVRGTAPALWNADYGTGAPTRTQCFGGGGNSATSLTNYADIPTEWK